MFDRAIENPMVRLPHCAMAHSHLHLAHLGFAQRRHQMLLQGEKMFTTVGNNAQRAEHQDGSAQVHHSDVGDQSGSVARNVHSTNTQSSGKNNGQSQNAWADCGRYTKLLDGCSGNRWTSERSTKQVCSYCTWDSATLIRS